MHPRHQRNAKGHFDFLSQSMPKSATYNLKKNASYFKNPLKSKWALQITVFIFQHFTCNDNNCKSVYKV